ncbi:DMT family transporter [Vibrio mexicanus]|uniref:DMT family transporter n=1 Tax=Vibrio mexicanus TaxID=1004326 RepID=UPI000AECD757|nr:DMT family transporter [Vibrio mexicanus]
MVPVTFFVEGPIGFTSISSGTWNAILALAVVSTALAYVLYFNILEAAGATNALLVTLLVPVSAIILGAVFLNESLEPIHFVGMGLIALGLSAIDGRLWKRSKREALIPK